MKTDTGPVPALRTSTAAPLVMLILLCGHLCGLWICPLEAQTVPADAQVLQISLGEAVRLAARSSAAVQVARYEARQTEARARQARSALFPSIDVFATDGARTFNSASLGFTFPAPPGQPPFFDPAGEVIGPQRNVDVRGRLTLPLFDLSIFQRLRSARTLAEAGGTDVATAAEQGGMTTALAYVQALRAEDEYRARANDSALAADLVDIAQQQRQRGMSMNLDVLRAQTRLASVRAQLATTRSMRDRTRLFLLRTLNLPLSTALVLTDSLQSLDLGGLALDERTAVSRALTSRPDLLAAEQRITSARHSLSAARMGWWPRLVFVGDYGLNGNSYRHLLNTYTYSVALSAPIFDGALRKGILQERSAQLHQAEVRRDDLRAQIEIDVHTSLIDLASAEQGVDAARDAVRLAEQEVTQARDLLRAGMAGNGDVITASLALTVARTVLIDALTNAQTARVALAGVQGALLLLP